MDQSKNCLTLALETSCDETSAAVIENGRKILSNIISSQVPVHQKFGGVVPEIASRKHIENVIPVVDACLKKAGAELGDIDHIGVTYGPGLVGALLVGVAAAKSLAYALDVPLVGVNHLEGHIFANFLSHPALEPPFVALVVSGGHTSLVEVQAYNAFRLLGQTRDDAAGEAFDKVARVMGLPYPGGPEIDRLAKEGDPDAVVFPRALHGKDNFEFSFSGLKSAVINYLHNAKQKGEVVRQSDVAAGFQKAVVEVLAEKALMALAHTKLQTLVLAGGVAANSALKNRLRSLLEEKNMRFYYPEPILCTDNAAMIGCRAYYQKESGRFADLYLNAMPNLKLSSF